MMSPIERIAIVVPLLPPVPIWAVSARLFHEYDAFAAALISHSPFEVTILEGSLASVRQDTFVLLDGDLEFWSLEGCDPALLSRIVILNAERPPALLETLERQRLAGGVETNRYRRWLHHRERESGGGLYGLRAVAPRMGVTCFEGTMSASENYCNLSSEACKDLPQLLARYIDAFKKNEESHE